MQMVLAIVKLGTKGQPDRWLVEAKGGSAGGNGGFVSIQPTDGSIQIRNQNAVDVSAIGPTGNGGKIELTSGKMLTFVGANTSLIANGGTTAGDGGSIFLNSIGNLGDFNVGTGADAVDLHANARGATGNGKGGTIDIAGFNNVTLTGAGLSVNAKGNGDGGTINIHDVATSLSVSGIIKAKGAGSGRGGNISLGANVNTTIDGIINASGGCDNGDGGSVTLAGNTVSTLGTIRANAGDSTSCVAVAATANSFVPNFLASSGKGGDINVIGCSTYSVTGAGLFVNASENGVGGNIVIDCFQAVTVAATLRANGLGSGKGGFIKLDGTELILNFATSTPRFLANGGSSGDGGEIRVTTGQVTNLNNTITSPIFESQGFDTGKGGRVIINYPNVLFKVNDVIKVASGKNASVGDFGGSITLSTKEVFRHKTGDTSWPQAIWSINSTLSTTDSQIAAAAATLPTGMRSILGAKKYELYAFFNTTEHDLFFFDVTANELGLTRPFYKTIAVFLDGNSFWEETTIHEAGHALDFSENELSLSPSFLAALDSQEANFNSQPCTTVFAGPTVVLCTLFPTSTNWERFTMGVTENNDPHEIFAQFFGFKGGVLSHGYPIEARQLLIFQRATFLKTYMDNLWLLY